MTISLVSLGCPKNLADSEVILGLGEAAGIVISDDPAEADAVVVNTCCFIEEATQESIDAILQLARLKTEGRCKRLFVTGCLVERYGQELRRTIPEIDCLIGIKLGNSCKL